MSMEPVASLKTLLWTWLTLLALLAVTAASAWLPLGPFNVVINLSVAFVKALLVMGFFMGLRGDSGAARLVAGAGFFWLLLLVGLSLSDYLTRRPLPAPW